MIPQEIIIELLTEAGLNAKRASFFDLSIIITHRSQNITLAYDEEAGTLTILDIWVFELADPNFTNKITELLNRHD